MISAKLAKRGEGEQSKSGGKKIKKPLNEDDSKMEDELPAGRNHLKMVTEEELINEEEDLEYEDAYDDVFEKEEIMEESSEHSSDFVTESEGEAENKDNREMKEEKVKVLVKKEKKKKKDKVTPFVGTAQNVDEKEELEFENRAYDMLHRATTEYPCLSCDFLTGSLPNSKVFSKPPKSEFKETEYPLDLLAISGTQASLPSKNQLYVLRYANLCQTKYDDDSDGNEDEKEEIAEGNPIIMQRSIPVKGGINRIRSMMGFPIVALWTEASQVKIYNVQAAVEELNALDISTIENSKLKGLLNESDCLLNSFKMSAEGFGLEWSPLKLGRLISGSSDSKINVFEAEDELCSNFTKMSHYYSYHTDSVEDLQFSPTQEDVFASCSVDRTVQVCDMRQNSYKKAQITIEAHDCDVNVISWNSLTANLIASGADDGSIKVWDLRYPKELPITHVKWHQDSITSLQWQPSDEWTLAAASADHRVSVWDFSVENNEQEMNEDFNVPEQIIFIHHGQEDVKELRWHPIYKDVLLTTAHTGFNIFKPAINDDAASEENSEDERVLDIKPIY